MLVVADRVADRVRREVIQGVAVSQRQRDVAALARAQPQAAAHDLIPICIVEGIQAVAREAGHPDAVPRALAPTAERRVERVAAVRPATQSDRPMWRSPTVAGEDLNDSRHRVRAVHHARRSAHYLDTLYVVGGEVGE